GLLQNRTERTRCLSRPPAAARRARFSLIWPSAPIPFGRPTASSCCSPVVRTPLDPARTQSTGGSRRSKGSSYTVPELQGYFTAKASWPTISSQFLATGEGTISTSLFPRPQGLAYGGRQGVASYGERAGATVAEGQPGWIERCVLGDAHRKRRALLQACGRPGSTSLRRLRRGGFVLVSRRQDGSYRFSAAKRATPR